MQKVGNCGRKTAKEGVLKGRSKEERLKKWFTHFSELLGEQPVISGNEEDEIISVLPEQDINTAPFTLEEYHAVRNINEIVLHFANKVVFLF